MGFLNKIVSAITAAPRLVGAALSGNAKDFKVFDNQKISTSLKQAYGGQVAVGVTAATAGAAAGKFSSPKKLAIDERKVLAQPAQTNKFLTQLQKPALKLITPKPLSKPLVNAIKPKVTEIIGGGGGIPGGETVSQKPQRNMFEKAATLALEKANIEKPKTNNNVGLFDKIGGFLSDTAVGKALTKGAQTQLKAAFSPGAGVMASAANPKSPMAIAYRDLFPPGTFPEPQQPGQPAAQQMPAWLMPVGFIVGIVVLLKILKVF